MLRNGKVLLGKRHSDPKKADSELHGEGSWTMPGGKLEFGETFEDGAVREVLEETGIKIRKTDLSFISVSNDIVEDAHFVTIGFLCTRSKGDASVLEPNEITEWGWFSLDALPSPLFFPSKKIFDNYTTDVFYQI